MFLLRFIENLSERSVGLTFVPEKSHSKAEQENKRECLARSERRAYKKHSLLTILG